MVLPQGATAPQLPHGDTGLSTAGPPFSGLERRMYLEKKEQCFLFLQPSHPMTGPECSS